VDLIGDYLWAVWDIVLELAPWLLLGAAVAGTLHVLMPRNFIRRHLGGRGAWTTVKAAVVGVPMPLCSCSVIPTGLGLHRDGAGRGATVSFLTSTPQTGVDSVAVTAAFLGWPFALFKLAAAFVTGVVGGIATNAVTHDDTATGLEPGEEEASRPSRSLADAWHFAVGDLLRMIWRWLVFGILVSAAISVAVEPGSLTFDGMGGGLVAMLLTLAISLPLYICATASVPIAAALVHAGLPTGAALVFLMAGPATNVATIGALYRVLGGRSTAVYLVTIVVGSVGLGLAYDAWIGLEAVSLGAGHEHGGHGSWWAIASAVALCALIGWFAIDDLRRLVTGGGGAGDCCSPAAEPEAAGGCCSPAAEPEAAGGCCASDGEATACGHGQAGTETRSTPSHTPCH